MYKPPELLRRIRKALPEPTPAGANAPGGAMWVSLLALAGLAVVAFQPFWTNEYAFYDDYTALAGPFEPGGMVTRIFRDGRPFYGLAYGAVYAAAATIDHLWWVRLVGALGILVLALLVVKMLRQLGETRTDATLVAGAVMLLAPMVVWASWAATFGYPWSGALGLAAGISFVDASRQHAVKAVMTGCAISMSWLLAALLIYQPGALFFWCVVLAGWLLGPRVPSADRYRRLLIAVALFGATTVIYFAIWKIYVPLVLPATGWSDRATLATLARLPEKLVWFVREPLTNTANLFSFAQDTRLAAIVAAAAVLGIVVRLRRQVTGALQDLAIVVMLVLLSHAVNLVVRDSWAAYRTMGALATSVLLLAAFGARDLLATHAVGRTVWRAAMGTAIAAQVLVVRWDVGPKIIGPQQQERRIVSARVRAAVAEQATQIVFRMPVWSDNRAPLSRYDEIGIPSSIAAVVPEPMVSVLHREITGRGFAGTVILVAPLPALEKPVPDGAFVIDMRAEYAAIR